MSSVFLNSIGYFHSIQWDLPLTLSKTEILYQVDPGHMCKHVCSLAGGGDLETFSISIINVLKNQWIHSLLFLH